jgi:hypothetical protein
LFQAAVFSEQRFLGVFPHLSLISDEFFDSVKRENDPYIFQITSKNEKKGISGIGGHPACPLIGGVLSPNMS